MQQVVAKEDAVDPKERLETLTKTKVAYATKRAGSEESR